jgi:DNA-binding NarL/FixJ family response regulator
MEKIKVMIVEDQIIFRRGLRLSLSVINNIELLEDATNGKEFLNLIKVIMPDVVLMDIKMPLMDGYEASKAAIALYPDIKIIVVSSYGEEESLIHMIEVGVKGFVLKDTDENELNKAIRKVNEGKNYFAQELLPILTSAFMKKRTYLHDKQGIEEKLTKREIEILKYICEGFTNKEIAEICFISPRTASGHRNNLLEKTGCKNTAQLVAFGIKYNMMN